MNLPRVRDAAILAGGKSRRMGRDKALVERGGDVLLACVARVLAAGFERLWLSVHERELDEARRSVIERLARERLEIRIVYDADVDRRFGPLAGMEAILDAVPGPAVIFAPVDAPGIERRLHDHLRERFEANPSLLGIVPRWHGGLEPLHALWSVEILPEIRSRIFERKLAVRALAELPGVEVLDVDERILGRPPHQVFLNLNEAGD